MKDLFHKNKGKLLLITYAFVLLLLVLNMQVIFDSIINVIHLLSALWLAIAIAFVLNLPMAKIECLLDKVLKEHSKVARYKRTMSILLTIIISIILLYLFLIVVIPNIADSIGRLTQVLPGMVDDLVKMIDDLLLRFGVEYDISNISEIQNYLDLSTESLIEQVTPFINTFANGVLSNAVAFTNSFFHFFLAFCLSLYLLAGKEKYLMQMKKITAAAFPRKIAYFFFEMGSDANRVFGQFIGGQLVACAFYGVFFYFVCLIMGYPFPELMAVIIGVFSIVPVFGSIFAMMVDFLLILTFDVQAAFLFIIIYQVLSNLISNLVYPKIVGNTIGLPGVWVMFSIFVLGDVYGVVGMVMAVPVTALVYSLIVRLVRSILDKKNVTVVGSKIVEEE